MKRHAIAILLALLALTPHLSISQVPFPPSQGRDFNAIEPYGYEKAGINWDTSPYLPFIYRGMWFRMMLPNGVTYNANTKTFSNQNPSQKYPLILFFHGRGEAGTDNQKQLLHGAEQHKNAVLNGAFPGFLLYPQSIGYQGGKEVLEKIIAELPVDINRIYVHGLSNGGQETWRFTIAYPTLVAAAFPMSAADEGSKTENLLYTPLRQAQGGLDTNPNPAYANSVRDWFVANGGHLEYFYLPTIGHGTWSTMYNRSDFFPWFLAQKKNQIMVRYERNLICEDAPVNVVMGFTPGFQAYEWRRNGTILPGETSYKLTTTVLGTYEGRIRNRGQWSEWSDPVVVDFKSATVTPPVTTNPLHSLVIPDVNGNSSITFALPSGFQSYQWNKQGVSEPIGTGQTVTVNSVGNYSASAIEVNGCSSIPSPVVSVVDANGPSKPDPISNLQAASSSLTSIQLTWEDNPAPTVNETGFEVYRASSEDGPFQLIGISSADVLQYTDTGLPQNTQFWYQVRPISATAAATASDIISVITELDIIPPTPPNNVTTSNGNANSVRVNWAASTDNTAVTGYEIYVREVPSENYILAYTAPPEARNQTIFQLLPDKFYNFIVKAKDAAGNRSAPSAIATYSLLQNGVTYSQYEGEWTSLPDFSTLTPVASGTMSNFSLSPRTRDDNFAFVYTGSINITTAAAYTFFLQSDEGSKLWINDVLVVDHDGIHNNTEKSGLITLPVGRYPIRVEYFDRTGTQNLTVSWQRSGMSKQTIPNSNLFRVHVPVPVVPANPTGLSLSGQTYKSIQVNWTMHTGNASHIEIFRSSPNGSTWFIIGTVPANVNSYVDDNLKPSTRHYYRIRAINAGGASGYTSSVNTFTQALPPIPAAPSALTTTNVGATSVALSWSDNSNNEDNFEIYKSAGNNGAYTKLNTVPGNSTQYEDMTLFPHTTYFYKVRSKNIAGNSNFSNEISLTTANVAPVLTGLTSTIVARYGQEHTVPLNVVDQDGDLIIIGATGLPPFAQIFDYGDGTGEVFLDPAETDQGVYPNIQIFAKDLYGGEQVVTVTLVINDNHTPVITDVAPLSIKETYTSKLVLTATDEDEDEITWSILNAPSFLTTTPDGNSLELRFQPGTNDAGTYNITVNATDANGAVGSEIIELTVTNWDPNFTVMVNFRNTQTYSVASAPWNNVGPSTANGTYALNTDSGVSAGITLTHAGPWNSSDDNGLAGNYPYQVQRSSFWHGGSPTQGTGTILLSGLNPDGKYNLSLLSSRTNDGNNRLTVYTVNGQSGQIQANGNTTTTVDFTNLTPNANGQLSIAVTRGSGALYAMVNALVLESFYDGNAVPDAPSGLSAQIVSSQVRLNWTDNSGNEQSFEVHRSTDNVNFTTIASISPDVTTYTDLTVAGSTQYYYRVVAINALGASPFSNVVSIVAPNQAPVIPAITPISIAEMEMDWVMVNATDNDGDQLTFTLEGAPGFVWTNWVDENSTLLAIEPYEGDRGDYQFLLRATDPHGASSTATINLTVSTQGEFEVKINFSQQTSGPAPWNNVLAFTAGTTLSNLKDDSNNNTPFSITLVNSWTGMNPNGYVTGNNSGIYPDAVMAQSFYIQDGTTRNISLQGLNPEKIYDFTFFASRMGVTPTTEVRNTRYMIGAKSAILNGVNNTSNTVKIIGVKPNANGQLTVSVAKETTSTFGYLNAMVIREYVDLGGVPTPNAPINLTAQVPSRSSIKLTWADASDNETNFEIWRSQGNNSNYTLLATLNPNVTTYTNTGLGASTAYYYKVRAINASGASEFSNETTASTYDFAVQINFNAFTSGPATWNNQPILLPTGTLRTALKDELQVNTGINMRILQEFTADNPYGMNTGNNSGIVPDAVMRGSNWLDPGTSAILRFENLSFLRMYSFGFFGSRDGTGDRTTVYTINGNSVSLNASQNTQVMVWINNVVPDENGTITVTISAPLSSLFGYLNALIIQAAPNTIGVPARVASKAEDNFKSAEGATIFAAYPNPFKDRITLQVGELQAPAFKVSLISATGVSVLEKEFDKEPGQDELELMIEDNVADGVYMLRVIESTGGSYVKRMIKK